LGQQGVSRSAHETFDFERLFDGFEE